MASSQIEVVSGAVEGMTDEAVLRRLLAAAGCRTGAVYGRNGKEKLREQVNGYNRAAEYAP